MVFLAINYYLFSYTCKHVIFQSKLYSLRDIANKEVESGLYILPVHKIGATNTQAHREKHQFHTAIILSSVSSGSRGSDTD